MKTASNQPIPFPTITTADLNAPLREMAESLEKAAMGDGTVKLLWDLSEQDADLARYIHNEVEEFRTPAKNDLRGPQPVEVMSTAQVKQLQHWLLEEAQVHIDWEPDGVITQNEIANAFDSAPLHTPKTHQHELALIAVERLEKYQAYTDASRSQRAKAYSEALVRGHVDAKADGSLNREGRSARSYAQSDAAKDTILLACRAAACGAYDAETLSVDMSAGYDAIDGVKAKLEAEFRAEHTLRVPLIWTGLYSVDDDRLGDDAVARALGFETLEDASAAANETIEGSVGDWDGWVSAHDVLVETDSPMDPRRRVPRRHTSLSDL